MSGATLGSPSRILVIDDEVDMLTNYRRMLERAGHDCRLESDPRRLEPLLSEYQPDLVLTDLVMPHGSGMEVLDRVRQFDPTLPVILLTAHGSIESAVEAMKRHATDYLTKPFSIEELLGKIQTALSRRLIEQSDEPGASGPPPAGNEGWRREIIGISPAIEKVITLARKVSRTDVNVLIQGESGTGKEVFARLIHRLSPRSQEILVPADCASLPENLLESELFGYRKGAFTGAHSDKMGLFEFAHKGTLLLDEIGEMPLALQAKLLRVLQERRFRPIGGREQIEVDVRVIAATNRDLAQALAEKTFRSDLYYRLNVVTLRLPPLRERLEDVPLLARHFLSQFARDNRLAVDAITPRALELLKAYDWPGNVRQLQNVVEHAATMAGEGAIGPEHLPEEFEPLRAAERAAREGDEASLFSRKTELVDHFERDYLVSLLIDQRFNISRAATVAGCHRRTLYRMIHRHRINLAELRRQHPA
ncbi:MAG TPA: sigma-54 dependent transcriptional regulator [Candidatus Sumerlaeota bacterium]|nr:MAG: Transcriptional regulatory protein QseF [candidate division BRC1 bacterium ADurb.BinA292]HOE96461.1 sigma-54 dependent transcriptional regulator [Candidatus Sumerlaeota bacterium]HOR26768.1 sigma-54 dependent transcriptional regulator [Candidatus Sumerlaeota bacterium]HPK01815.1 sigma-54 dependent transcriptional regulator [Candidatus Sumerlaeota bacterium]